MYYRYIVLDEVELDLLKNQFTDKTMVFDTVEDARNQAQRWRDSWRIIDIPFFDEHDSLTGAIGE